MTALVVIDTDISIDASRAFGEAIAQVLDAPFVSKNQSDYRFIAGLNLLGYPNPFRSS